MKYLLTVTKIEKNPDYNPRDMYSTQNQEREFKSVCLEVALEETEFIAVKKAVIEVIK